MTPAEFHNIFIIAFMTASTILLCVFGLVLLKTWDDKCKYAGGDYIEVVDPSSCYSVSEDKYLPLSR